MGACRWLGVLFGVMASATLARAQTYVLAEDNRAGDCFRVRLEMQLQGEMRVARNGRQVPLKLQAQSGHDFWERTLNVGKESYPDKLSLLRSCPRCHRSRATQRRHCEVTGVDVSGPRIISVYGAGP